MIEGTSIAKHFTRIFVILSYDETRAKWPGVVNHHEDAVHVPDQGVLDISDALGVMPQR
jgi:hypothetical protein